MLKFLGPNKDADKPASHDAEAPYTSISRKKFSSERKLFRCVRQKWRKAIINDA